MPALPAGAARKRLQFVVLLALVVALAGCTTGKRAPASGSTSPANTAITIGVLADLSGEGALSAAEIHLNVDLAIAQANAGGGVNGRQVRAVYADPRADPGLAVSLAKQLVEQNGATVLVGGVFSSECLALAQEASREGVTYLSASGCPTPDLTAKSCNRYSFRVLPVDSQLIPPLAKYLAGAYGRRWAAIYPAYAYGQAQLAGYEQAMVALGGSISTQIAVPVGVTDASPYVAQIPADGSIDGLLNLEQGTDLARVDDALQRSGLSRQMPVVFSGNKETFGGVYPEAVNGFVFSTVHPSVPQPDNSYDQAYAQAFQQQAAKEPQYASTLGGPAKAVSGALGYQTYAAISALIQGMSNTGFTGRRDTPKLIAALQSTNAPLSAAFPGGQVQMNPSDHQGRAQIYIEKVDGQSEDLLQTVPPEDLPQIGNCHV
jgi:branched-chain amino acid transport system substrate-binding protein